LSGRGGLTAREALWRGRDADVLDAAETVGRDFSRSLRSGKG
jgi:hypothetical protein